MSIFIRIYIYVWIKTRAKLPKSSQRSPNPEFRTQIPETLDPRNPKLGCLLAFIVDVCSQICLTESVYEVIWQTLIRAQIRQLMLHFY